MNTHFINRSAKGSTTFKKIAKLIQNLIFEEPIGNSWIHADHWC